MTDLSSLDLARFTLGDESLRSITDAPWILRPGVIVATDGYMGLRLDGELPDALTLDPATGAQCAPVIDCASGRMGKVDRAAIVRACGSPPVRDPTTIEPCIESHDPLDIEYGRAHGHDCQWLPWLECFAYEACWERVPRFVGLGGSWFDGTRLAELLTTCPAVDTLDVLLHGDSLYLDAPGWRAFLARMADPPEIDVAWAPEADS